MRSVACHLPIVFGVGPTWLWLLLEDYPWRCRGGCGALLDGPGTCPACAQRVHDRDQGQDR